MAGGSDGNQDAEIGVQNAEIEQNQQMSELNAALQQQIQHSNSLQHELNTLRDQMTEYFTKMNQNRETAAPVRPAPPVPTNRNLTRQNTHENLDQIDRVSIPVEINAVMTNQNNQTRNLGARPRTTSNASNSRSRFRSSSRSRANSRQASPDNVAGVVPLTYDALKAVKIILQGKTDQYEDALRDLRSHTSDPNSVYNRIKSEHAAIERKTQENIAKELPKVLGLHRISPAIKIKILTVPQDQENQQFGATCQREFTKGNPIRLKGKSPNVRYVIEALRNRYDGKLTHRQIQQILVDLSDSNFKDIVTNAFEVSDTNKAIQHLLDYYGEMPDDVQLTSQFYNTRLDFKNLEESMIMILEKARQCFKHLSHDAINEKAMEKILNALPKQSVSAIQEKMKQTERLRKWNDSVEPVDFNTFMKYVTDNFSLENNRQRQIRPIQAIGTIEETKEESNQESSRNETSHNPLNAVADKLMVAINALDNRSKSKQPFKPSKFLSPNEKEYQDAIRSFEIKGTMLNLIKEVTTFNASKRKRHWPLKRTSDPNQHVNYRYNSNGKIIPANDKIDFETIIKTPGGKYTLTDKIMQRISEVCYKCGQSDCGANNVNCIYKNAPEVFSPCTLCHQGFHPDHSCVAENDQD